MTAALLDPGPDWPPVPFEDLWDPGPDEAACQELYEEPGASRPEDARDPEVVGLEALDGLARAEAVAYADQVRRLAGLVALGRRDPHRPEPERFLALELAGTLRLGQGAALGRLDEAERLTDDLPLLLSVLAVGTVLVPQVRIVLYESRNASSAVAAELDRRLHALITLPAARDPRVVGWDGWYAVRLRRRVRQLLVAIESELEPNAVAEREERARQGRRVSARPEPDGMASLWALLPAEQARAFTLGLDELQRRQRITDLADGVDRTVDQRRADLFALLPALALHALDGTTPAPGPDRSGSIGYPSVLVNVHVPVASALALSHEPGTMEGHGPISAEHVRRLLPSAALRLVLVDEGTGEPLYLDPTVHPPGEGTPGRSTRVGSPRRSPDNPGSTPPSRASVHERVRALVPDRPLLVVDEHEPQHDPSAGLARFVRLRDPLCTGPGCAVASYRSDLDHLLAWPLGPTCADNLGPKSRRCHRAKTLSWAVTRHPDGSHTWHSPTGRAYRVPPAWSPPPALRRRRLAPVTVDPWRVGGLLMQGGDLTSRLDEPGTARPVEREDAPLQAGLDDTPPPF